MDVEYNPVYTPLKDPDRYFRLLKLDEASDQDRERLSGVLITLPREDAPPYHPISYTWGDQKATARIFLRNSETGHSYPFDIRPNLEVFLHHARRSFTNRVIWVDAICINQEDNNEKGHQVRTMDKVYRGQKTFVWLGEPSHNSDLALDLIDCFEAHLEKLLDRSRLRRLCETVGSQAVANRSVAGQEMYKACNEFLNSPINTEESWGAIYDLFCRPWFTRRWVVQEFALSGHVDFWIGNRKTCLNAMSTLALKLKEIPRHLVGGRDRRNVCESELGHSYVLPSNEVDPIDGINRLIGTKRALTTGKTSELSLERLLDNFAGFACFDPRDGVYSLVSMASDINISEWFPDYSVEATVGDLYRKVSSEIIKKQGLWISCATVQIFNLYNSPTHLILAGFHSLPPWI